MLINFHITNYKENSRNDGKQQIFSVQCTIRFGHVFSTHTTYTLSKSSFLESEPKITTTNKSKRQRNHSIIYFCPLSTLCVRVCGVCECNVYTRAPEYHRINVCENMYTFTESESKTIARVMSASAASKQKPEQNR